MKTLIKKWLIKRWLKKYKITNYTINANGEIDVDGDVNLTFGDIKKFPSYIQFGKVNGYFSCNLTKLISLKGAPKKVKGSFYCRLNELTTLEGAPREVGGDFYCTYNNLTTLKGAPREVGGNFVCFVNKIQFTEEDVRKICKVKDNIYV